MSVFCAAFALYEGLLWTLTRLSGATTISYSSPDRRLDRGAQRADLRRTDDTEPAGAAYTCGGSSDRAQVANALSPSVPRVRPPVRAWPRMMAQDRAGT